MSSVTSTNGGAQSVEALNQVMEMAQKEQVDFAKKIIKANVEVAVSSASVEGVGDNIDLIA